MFDQFGFGHFLQVCTGMQVHALHLPGGDPSDSKKFLHRQRFDECFYTGGADKSESIGLIHIRRSLRSVMNGYSGGGGEL